MKYCALCEQLTMVLPFQYWQWELRLLSLLVSIFGRLVSCWVSLAHSHNPGKGCWYNVETQSRERE